MSEKNVTIYKLFMTSFVLSVVEIIKFKPFPLDTYCFSVTQC